MRQSFPEGGAAGELARALPGHPLRPEDAADLLRAWARGEAESPEMDDGFRKWQQENAEELSNWYSDEDLIKQELDKTGRFATIDTGSVARAIRANPTIDDGKIYRYMLNPEKNHYQDFVRAGYSKPEDGERLRTEILRQSKDAAVLSFKNGNNDPRDVGFNTCIYLGDPPKRFIVGWQVNYGDDHARLITCFRKDEKKE